LRRILHSSGAGVGVGEELLDWNKFHGGYEDPISIQSCHRYEIFWNSFMASVLIMEPVRS
jgi:hypothetical protein